MENEKRLIDANALIAEYDRVHIGTPGGARKLIEEAPSVDAVEVVRCKDCKYSEWDCDCGLYLCLYHGCDWNNGDHFCSYGERKDNG